MQSATRRKLSENLSAYMFVGPFVVLCGMFIVYPILQGFINSLFNTKWRATVFVGFQNYKTFSVRISIYSPSRTACCSS